MEDNITGKRLEYLRERRGLSKAELAKRLGFSSYSTITSWENGNSFPRAKELIRLSKMYGVTSDYILGMSDNED